MKNLLSRPVSGQLMARIGYPTGRANGKISYPA